MYVWSQPHNTCEHENLRVWIGAGRLTCKEELPIKHETWVLKPESLQEQGRYHRWVKPAGYNKNQTMSWFLFCFSTFDVVQRKSVQLVRKIWSKLEDKWKLSVSCCCLVAKLCPTLCDPMDCSLPGSSVHGILQGKNTGAGCHFLL